MTRGLRQGGNARLSEDNVRTMRQRYAAGATQRELCQVYGVSITTVGRIVRGETWGWIDAGTGTGGPEAPLDWVPPTLTPDQEAEMQRKAAESAARLAEILKEQGKG